MGIGLDWVGLGRKSNDHRREGPPKQHFHSLKVVGVRTVLTII